MNKIITVALVTWVAGASLLSAFDSKPVAAKPEFEIEQGCLHVEGSGFMVFATISTQFEVKSKKGPVTFRGPVVWNIECSPGGCTGAMFNMAAAHETRKLTSVMLQPIYRTHITDYNDDGAIAVGQSIADPTKLQKFTLNFNTGRFTFETETDEIKIVGDGNVGRCGTTKRDEKDDMPELKENPNPVPHRDNAGTIEL